MPQQRSVASVAGFKSSMAMLEKVMIGPFGPDEPGRILFQDKTEDELRSNE